MTKPLIAAVLLCYLGLGAVAQSKQIIYYPDGKKAVEGNWRYTSIRPFGGYSNNILTGMMEDRPFGANYLNQLEKLMNQCPLSMVFNGSFKSWYKDGTQRVVCTYDNGVLKGPATLYFPGGEKMIEANFTSGGLTGTYTDYYDDRRVHLKGQFKPFSNLELDSMLWYARPSMPGRSNAKSDARQQLVEAVNREFNSTYHIPALGKKEGRFEYYVPTGALQAVMVFKNNQAEGEWILYRDGRVYLKALYHADTLVKATDSTGIDWLVKMKTDEEARTRNLSQTGSGEELVSIDPFSASDRSAPVAPAGERIFTYVEQMPQFPGGDAALNQYLKTNLRYPAAAKKEGLEGRVILRFVVQTDGSLSDITVMRGFDKDCDQEAIRLVRKMPRWKPGIQNGHPVRVTFTLPVKFKLED
jgi:protein TonB